MHMSNYHLGTTIHVNNKKSLYIAEAVLSIRWYVHGSYMCKLSTQTCNKVCSYLSNTHTTTLLLIRIPIHNNTTMQYSILLIFVCFSSNIIQCIKQIKEVVLKRNNRKFAFHGEESQDCTQIPGHNARIIVSTRKI